MSMFFIVFWHLLTRSHLFEHCSDTLLLILKFIQYFMIVHVNSFVLVTGYFQYNKILKPQKIFTLLNQSWFYRVLAVILFSFLGVVTLSPVAIVKNVFPLDITDSYWFLNCYIVLLCLSPFINQLIEKMSQKEHRHLIFLFLLLFSIIPNISYQLNIKNDGFSVIQFILLYFIGAYFAKYPLKKNLHFKNFSKYKTRLILIVIFIATWLFNYFLYHFASYLISFQNLNIKELGLYLRQGCECYGSLFVLIQSACYFLFFETLCFQKKVINHIASLMLGVYFIHENPLVRTWLYKFLHLDVDYILSSNILIIKLFALALAIFIICMLIEQLRVLLFNFVNHRKCIIKTTKKIADIVKEF